MDQKTLNKAAWTVFVVSVSLAIYSWGSRVDWGIGSLSPYQWFPLFGLLAWMTMWGHYVIGYFRVKNPSLKKVPNYNKLTGYVVLASILAHPGILAIEQANNGQGAPPQSFIDYVGENLALAVTLGTLSLLIFLSFEVFNRMRKNKTIKKYWTLVSLSQSLAMILIFVHALRLGSDLGDGWFRVVWILYGLALLPCFYVVHKADFTKK